MEKNIDSVVSELLAKVKTEKVLVEALKSTVSKSWITTCTIGFDGSPSKINIQTAQESTLIEILSKLYILADAHTAVLSILNMPSREFTYQGYTFSDWTADVKKRISLLELKTKEANLALIEAKLDTLVSPDKRREMELDDVIAMINKL